METSAVIRIVLLSIGVGIAAITLFWNVYKHVQHRRKKILINYSLENGFIYKDKPEDETINSIPHRVVLKIVNGGEHSCVIGLPVLRLSRRIDGEQDWSCFEGGEEELEPELMSGQTLDKSYNLEQILEGPASRLKNRDSLRFVVSDSIGNEYESKNLKLKSLRMFAKQSLEDAIFRPPSQVEHV